MNTPEKRATILFLVRDNQILLAMKKRGFGAGRWNGTGGKPEGTETIEQTAIRECQEEICVTPTRFKQVGHINFFFPPNKSDWNQQVFVYFCDEWTGEPTETDEMQPQWFDIENIPYDTMWADDKYWLPEILAGKYIDAEITFDDKDDVISKSVIAKPML